MDAGGDRAGDPRRARSRCGGREKVELVMPE
jgi:hypothetical protein